MLANKGKGAKRNNGNVSDERPTTTPRIDAEVHHAPDENKGQGPGQEGQGQPVPLNSVRYNEKIETFGMSRLCMDFEGESGRKLKESLIESIRSCPTDLDLICSDGVASTHRFILMRVSNFFFQLLRDRDVKDTEAITLVDVSITQISRVLELIDSGATIVKEMDDEDGLREMLNLFQIKMILERKEATVDDLAMCDTLEEAEVAIKKDDEGSTLQTVEENRGPRGNEAENEKASNNNANTVEDVIVIEDDVCTATPARATHKKTETGALETKPNLQIYRAGPYSQSQEMQTDESDSDSEVEEENDSDSATDVEVDKENDSLPSDSDDDENSENEKGKCNGDDRGSNQNGDGEDKFENELIDLTSDCEDETCNRKEEDDEGEIVEKNGGKNGNERENETVSKNNARTVEEDVIVDDVCTLTTAEATHSVIETGALETNGNRQDCRALSDSQPHPLETEQSPPPSSLDESKSPRNLTTAAEAGPSQLDLREPSYPTEGHVTLNGKKIRWQLMEALSSLTSPELRHERMRVFTLDVIQTPREDLRLEVRNLFKSLPENSLEKRLGMMAVQCENYREIELAELTLVQSRNYNFFRFISLMKDIELVGVPPGNPNIVRRINFHYRESSSELIQVLIDEMLKDDRDAFSNLMNYEKLLYWDKPIEQNRLLEIGNIKGLEGRAKALIKMNVAGRILPTHPFSGPLFGWHEDYEQRVIPEFGGVGWDVWSHNWLSQSDVFIFNLTGTQILFPTLAKDVDLSKKMIAEQVGKGEPPLPGHGVAVSPNCLLQNKISCFPVVQKPGVLIYKYNGKDTRRTCDISKLRLDMGAEIEL